jgi:type I restriction enzyme S subunit
VDALLAALDRLIAKQRDLKQAAMQQLLTGQTRLPGFKGEWVETALGNIGKFKNGFNKDSSAFGHGSPFVNLMDVFGVNAIASTSHLGLVASTKMDQEVYDLQPGDVLFIRSSVKPSGVGLTAVVDCDLPNTVYSGFLIRFRDGGTLDSGFKKHCFYAETFRKKLIAASSVSANTNINQTALGALTVLLPPTKAEQTAIATVLSDMDVELAVLEQRRDKTRALKQGMMQELLTGRTRLI